MVDTKDLKSFGQKCPCEFESRFEHRNNFSAKRLLKNISECLALKLFSAVDTATPRKKKEEMEMRSPLDLTVTLTDSVLRRNPADQRRVSLRSILLGDSFRQQVEKVRALPYHSSQQSDAKRNLPAFWLATFNGRIDKDHVENTLPIIALDFDRKDNSDSATGEMTPEFAAFKTLAETMPFVLYVGLSCSGEGYRVLVPIANADERDSHYVAAEQFFREYYGLHADPACKDVARAFYVSHDPSPYVNEQAGTFVHVRGDACLLSPETAAAKTSAASKPAGTNHRRTATHAHFSDDLFEKLIERTEASGAVAFDSYHSWVRAGIVLANNFGENGRELFHRLSSLSPKYDREECDTKYGQLLNFRSASCGNQATMGSIVWELKEACK